MSITLSIDDNRRHHDPRSELALPFAEQRRVDEHLAGDSRYALGGDLLREMTERRQRIRRQRLSAVRVILVDERVRPVLLFASGEVRITARDEDEIALNGPVPNGPRAIDARSELMVRA